MKGFLKKDLALLYNTGKVYLAVIAMGIVLGLVNKEMRSFSSSFIMIMLALAGASTLSYDDFENGMPFLISLPVSKKTYIKEKSRIVGMGFVVAIFLASFCIGYLFKLFSVDIDALIRDAQENIPKLALVLGVMGFCMVIMLISYTFSVKALEKKEF